MADPKVSHQGRLLSHEGRYAEVVLDAELRPGSLVQFQSTETLYLGAIESGWTEAGAHRLRVLIEHSVNLERAAAIRRLWNTDSPY
jgi:hypothetical protein